MSSKGPPTKKFKSDPEYKDDSDFDESPPYQEPMNLHQRDSIHQPVFQFKSILTFEDFDYEPSDLVGQ